MSKPEQHWTDYHPVYLDLRARRILIVGGGSIALEKLRSLLPPEFMGLPDAHAGTTTPDPPPKSSSRSERRTSGERDLSPPTTLSPDIMGLPDAHAGTITPDSPPNPLLSPEVMGVPDVRAGTTAPDAPISQPQITVVSPEAVPQIRAWHDEGVLVWKQRDFEDADIGDAYMVIAATDDPALNARVYELGDAANRLTNSVDDPAHCNFIMAAIGRRGPMQVAVSSSGCSPALAQRVRHRILSEILTEEVGELADFLGARRPEVKDRLPGYRVRQAFWERSLDSEIPVLLRKNEAAQADQAFEEMLDQAVAQAPGDPGARKGKVYLVGAGPGDPELITLKAVRALQRADVVLYDRLVNPRLLEHAPPKAERIYVGKRTPPLAGGCSCRLEGEGQGWGLSDARGCSCPSTTASHDRQQQINDMLIEHARSGRVVVRLKGGDPFVFGRGGEEMLALRAAGVGVEVIPGVSSAIAGPEAAGIPVTHRGISTSFGVFAGHEADGRDDVAWDVAARMPTAVFLMGVERLRAIAANLIAQGRDPETPAAVVCKATTADQKVVTGTLANIAERAANLPSPAVIVVGEVVNVSLGKANEGEKVDCGLLTPCLV